MWFRPSIAAIGTAVLILAAACASPSPPAPTLPERPAPPHSSVVRPGGSARLSLVRSLLGSAYRHGGAAPSGFDCSGLVLYVLEREGVVSPRTTREQAGLGIWVPLDEVKAGDLVFFGEDGDEPHHVGIAVSRLGEPLRMIHASTSRGVVETEVLASEYWLQRLLFGRRVVGQLSR